MAVALSGLLAATGYGPGPADRELIVCGWDEVFILDLGETPAPRVWSWKAETRPELPEGMRQKFKTTDECKPVDGGTRILITSSGDGVALVDRKTGKVLFYGSAGGAHSAVMLPGGRIAVAASTSKSPRNNSLVVFDISKPDQPLFQTELVSGHGVVWDEERLLLWALGLEQLRAYKLVDWQSNKPELEMADEYRLPDRGGHDLSPVPRTGFLSVTTERRAFFFDRDQRTFRPHPMFGGVENVKSITVNPLTGQIVWTKADPGFWWTETLRLANPVKSIERPGERLYKARWVNAEATVR